MTWTYIFPGTAGATDKDVIRLRVGDTDQREPLIEDEEIQYYIDNALHPPAKSINEAAWQVALSIAAKFERLCDKTIGDLKLSASQKAEHFHKLAARLKSECMSAGPSFRPIYGRPAFGRSMMNNPAAGPLVTTFPSYYYKDSDYVQSITGPDVPEDEALGFGYPEREDMGP